MEVYIKANSQRGIAMLLIEKCLNAEFISHLSWSGQGKTKQPGELFKFDKTLASVYMLSK